LDSSGSGHEPVVWLCEHADDISGRIKTHNLIVT
jgi:hypothetical protein